MQGGPWVLKLRSFAAGGMELSWVSLSPLNAWALSKNLGPTCAWPGPGGCWASQPRCPHACLVAVRVDRSPHGETQPFICVAVRQPGLIRPCVVCSRLAICLRHQGVLLKRRAHCLCGGSYRGPPTP